MKIYKIVMRAMSVRHDFASGLSYEDAVNICNAYNWFYCPDGEGGFEWELDIEIESEVA